MVALDHPYISTYKNGRISYGGSQTWSDSAVLRSCGCGIISAMDLIIYLAKNHPDCRSKDFPGVLFFDKLDEKTYDSYTKRLSLKYMPLLPPFGINGLNLVLGLNIFFHRYKMPVRARWGVKRKELWPKIEKMLSDDIPVILAIGPNFPRFWQKNKTSLYVLDGEDNPRTAAETHSHFVNVTGLSENWMQVSSWGCKLYIKRSEYEEYVTKYSNSILSSIVYISKINRRG